MNKFQALAYLKYRLKARYKKGHGIHPPFAYDIVRHLFYEDDRYYFFDQISKQRQRYLKSQETVEVDDYGAGSVKFKSNVRSVSQLVKYNATPELQGELISRFVVKYKLKTIIELGTSVGLGTMYLAKPDSKAKVYTIEGCQNLSEIAKKTFDENNIQNTEFITGVFDDQLPKVLKNMDKVDMVYFDGHHKYAATKKYFEMCLPHASEEAIFIFDDIHWSAEMDKFWEECIVHPQVSVSFDLFRFGIAIMNKNVQKQHYVVNWP